MADYLEYTKFAYSKRYENANSQLIYFDISITFLQQL